MRLPPNSVRYSRQVAALLLLMLSTGCYRKVSHSGLGSGYTVGVAVSPTIAVVAASLVGLIGYVAWRRGSKR